MSSHKAQRPPLFELAFSFFLVITVIFVVWNLWAIISGGIMHLPRALHSSEIRSAIFLSLWTSSLSSVLCMCFALPSSYLLGCRTFPGRRLCEAILGLPLCLPYLVLGLCLLTTFSSPFGKLLKQFGLRIVFDPRGIVVAHILVNLPFAIQMCTNAFRHMDPELIMAAQDLGANHFQVFRDVTLPLCRSSLLSTLLLTWSRGLGEFGATLMLVGVTRMKTETLPASIYLNISTGDNGLALASALLLLMMSLILQLMIYFLRETGGSTS